MRLLEIVWSELWAGVAFVLVCLAMGYAVPWLLYLWLLHILGVWS